MELFVLWKWNRWLNDVGLIHLENNSTCGIILAWRYLWSPLWTRRTRWCRWAGSPAYVLQTGSRRPWRWPRSGGTARPGGANKSGVVQLSFNSRRIRVTSLHCVSRSVYELNGKSSPLLHLLPPLVYQSNQILRIRFLWGHKGALDGPLSQVQVFIPISDCLDLILSSSHWTKLGSKETKIENFSDEQVVFWRCVLTVG